MEHLYTEIEQDSVNPSFYEEETRDMLGIPPTWMTKWGNGLIFIIVACIAIALFNVRYPTVLSGYIKMDRQNALYPIIAPTDGYVSSYLVNDRSLVKKNQPLFYFRSNFDSSQFMAIYDGLVIYTNNMMGNKYVKKGSTIMYLKPAIANNKGVMVVDKKYLKDIKIDQEVIIASSILGGDQSKGNISEIKFDTLNNSFMLHVNFKSGIGKNQILFSDTMIASIVLENKKLIDKLFRKKNDE